MSSQQPVGKRLEEIESMAEQYEDAAEHRGQEVNAANYRNLWKAIQNLRTDLEGQR